MPDSALPRTGLALLKNDGSDSTTYYRTNIRDIGAWVEANSAMYSTAAFASLPAAGKVGRLFHPTDGGREGELYWDTGSTWLQVSPTPATDPAAGTGGLRTLGAGATQAAAGNHGHTVDAAAGTGSFRTLGTGSTQAAAGDHTHSVAYSACKTSDTARSLTTTVADDPHLILTLPDGTYAFQLSVIGSTANTASNNNFKAKLNPTGAGSVSYQVISSGTDAASNTQTTTLIGTTTTSFLPMSASTNAFLRLYQGVFTVTGGGVVLALQWAQPSSSSNALTLYGGSYMTAIKQ